MKEISTLLVKLHIIFARMQRVNQHARPSIIQVGCLTCCYQVCALDHANVGTADLDYSSVPCHRNASPQHSTQFTPLVAGKKLHRHFVYGLSIYSGPDSNACSLLWIKHATSRDVVTAKCLWKLQVNSIIAHVTKYVICAYPARKWLNFASIFTDHSSAREIILTIALSSSGNKFRYVVV